MDKGDVFERVTSDVTFTLETGDVLLLYTDGVNEATDHKELLFGEERIETDPRPVRPAGRPGRRRRPLQSRERVPRRTSRKTTTSPWSPSGGNELRAAA